MNENRIKLCFVLSVVSMYANAVCAVRINQEQYDQITNNFIRFIVVLLQWTSVC